ncbi:MAG: hypothetical protein K6C12_09865 [Oscillospiraceae bacterium]|nr:hypothetical protein [Oscillospiraceae bacterium]
MIFTKTQNGKVFSGKCVTALDLDNNRVLRLVQNRRGAPVENPYCDLFEPLDCFDITVTESCPLLCQTENVLANYQFAHENYQGKYEGDIQDLYERFQQIYYGDSSFMLDGSYKLMDITPFKHSLELIRVSGLTIEGKKCSFLHKDKQFRLVSITDPRFVQPEKSVKTIGDAILAVSIPADNYKEMGYYKFVASVFPTGKP